MKEKTAEEWAEIFDAHEVWYAPIARFEEVHRDPQALATGAIDTDTAGVPTALVNSPIQFSAGAETRPQGPAPRHAGLWMNFGHGHQGFTLGPTTGNLLAQMVAGETPGGFGALLPEGRLQR